MSKNKRTKRDWDTDSQLLVDLQPTLIEPSSSDRLPFKKGALRSMKDSDLKVLHYVLG